MSTPAQITANRLNSQQSTGPITDAGKAASSANSFKHGLTATRIAPADRAEFEALERDLRNEFQAVTPTEERLVDTMIMAAWSLKRCLELQEQLWQLLTQGDQPKTMAQAYLEDCKGPRAIDKLHRYIRDHERTFERAQRRFAESEDAREAERQMELRRQAQAERQARGPAGNGFVSLRTPPAPSPEPVNPKRDRFALRGDENPALRL
jgi:hypothetical protein